MHPSDHGATDARTRPGTWSRCRALQPHRFLACVTLCLVHLLLGGAGTYAAASPLLDLAACRALALETAPEMAGANADVEATRLGTRMAGAAFLPALRGEGSYLRSSVDRRGMPDFVANNGENEYVARGVVTQPVYTGGSLTAGRAKARAEEAGAKHGLALARAEVLLSADRAYFAVLGAGEKRAIAEAALAVSQELLKATRVRLENGEVPAFDVAKLDLEVANATTALRGAEAETAIARNDLATLIGLPPDGFTLAPLETARGSAADLASLDELVARALAERPDVKKTEAEVHATEEAVGLAHGARFPQVTAEAAGGYDSLNLPDRNNVGWQAGLAVSVPVWDWNILANREQVARLDVEKARQRLVAAQRAVKSEVNRAYLEAKLARERLDMSAAAEQLASRNADIARRGYDLGLVSSLDLITAERQLTTARSEHAAARYAEHFALSELEFATGRLR
jgi:outer membrane protein